MITACGGPAQSLTTDRTWIRTFTGRQFWPLQPRPFDVAIEDIAHALALQCRYTGHVKSFYSVAQHSCLVSDFFSIPEFKWQGLMHDASEAYLVDIATPVKRQLSEYGPAEEKLMHILSDVFGFDWPMFPRVKEADTILLITEQRDLMDYINPEFPHLAPLHKKIIPWGPAKAEREFLKRYYQLRPNIK